MDCSQTNQLLDSAKEKLKAAIEDKTSVDLTVDEMTVVLEQIEDLVVIPLLNMDEPTQTMQLLNKQPEN